VLSVVASLEVGSSEAAAGVPAVTPTAIAGAGCITPLDVLVGRGKFFCFPSGSRGHSHVRWSC
jgi:hypothetical protein